jgi:putative transcriptional regulator
MKTLGRQNSFVIGEHFSTKGQLLVAAPALEDPNFHRTVIFMLEHRADGAVGVVINRPLADPHHVSGIDDWLTLLHEPAMIYYGGPVEVDGLIGIASMRGPIGDRPETTSDDSEPLPADEWVLGTVDLAAAPYEAAAQVGSVRIFRGYAGWGPMQLDSELATDSWIVVAAEPGDVFDPQPERLWRTVLRRQGGRVAWLADAPNDLSAN